jgi:thiol-disulfide isomerase/thioredoxin
MNSRNIFLSLILVTAFVLTACGGASTPDAMMDKPTEEAMMEQPTEDAMMAEPTMDSMMAEPTADGMMLHETPTPDAMAPTADAMMMESPAWLSASLTDASTNQTFSINDFNGKVVLVETMAVWCTTCYAQQQQIKALHTALGMRDDFVSVSLDIDPNENLSTVQKYLEPGEFDWLYAVAPADVSREIGSLYGAQFLNPPSAPILLVDRHGGTHPLPFGLKSADDLMKFIQPFLDEGM